MTNKFLCSCLALLLIGSGMVYGQRRPRPQRQFMPAKEMALQLYSIRDLIGDAEKYAQNHARVFKQLKQMGYTAVEAANYVDGKFYGVSPQQFRKDVQEAGLAVLSSHATRGLSAEELKNHDFESAMKWWKEAIKAHKVAGMSYIVTPWTDVPNTLEEAQTLCDYHNAVGKLCRESGLLYGYHSHSHEFGKVGNEMWYNYFVSHTNPEYVFFQMDVYWTVMGQQSPVALFKKYPGRFKLLHIKDMYELGESGMVGFDAIFKHAKEAGLRGYVVEMEATDGTIDIMEGLKRCADYLHRSKFVKPSYMAK
uniref:Sugar phosphate isomerase/epimerase n=1 Tax=Prevotella sp. GTC17262 TaxID=3236797 RepID=A0AB33JKR1_9BACT